MSGKMCVCVCVCVCVCERDTHEISKETMTATFDNLKGWLQCYPEKLRVCPKHRWLFLPDIRPVYLDGLFHH